MSKIAFVQKRAFEKISTHFLAGALRAQGLNYDLFIGDLEDDFFAAVCRYEPDYVVFSLFIGEEDWAFSCLRRLKILLPGMKTLIGGPFALIFPEIIERPEVDFLFRGDGEFVLSEFFRRRATGLEIGDLPGVSTLDDDGMVQANSQLKLVDVEEIPAPDRDLYYKYDVLRNNPTKIFIAARGCPYRCTYCYNVELSNYFETSYWRQRRVEDVIAEIVYVKKTYGLQWVHFQDGTFNANPKWLREFLDGYKENRLPGFLCNCRVEHMQAETAQQLKEAGCDRITFGIQSGSERVRDELAGRKMTNEKIIEACGYCRDNSIRVGVDIIFGWPGETLAEALETIKLCREIAVENYSSNVLIFYPGLRITRFAVEHGFIAKDPTLEEIYRLNANKSFLLAKEKNLLINLDKLFFYLIRFPRLEKPLLGLARLPTNRFFYMLKNLHQLLRSMKYDSNTSNWSILKAYVVKSWKMDLY